MTAKKGKDEMLKKSATVAAGAIMAMGVAGPAVADAGVQSAAVGSPGVISGNVIEVPVHVPVNLCGNSIDVVGLLNPVFGNKCVAD
ncbi:chaplin ChpD [Streptomyces roseiscleroticus]|nr:chaplin [Streptomyces ruber]